MNSFRKYLLEVMLSQSYDDTPIYKHVRQLLEKGPDI